MFSGKLIQQIEGHWDQIAGNVLKEIRAEPRLAHIRTLPEAELRDVARSILKNLGHWLTSPNHTELEQRYETLGRLRACESVPLHEWVRALQIVKAQMLEFSRSQGFTQSTLDILDEEELEHRVGEFFDDLVYHTVRGYEDALRRVGSMRAAS